MPNLIPRQERFCQAFVQYGTAAAAARGAGYSSHSARKQGWRLLRSARIRARIQEIQADLVDHRHRAHEAMVGKLEIVYCRALDAAQYSAAARAAELQARLIGEIGGACRAQEAAMSPSDKSPATAPETSTPCGQMRPAAPNTSPMRTDAEVRPTAAQAAIPRGA